MISRRAIPPEKLRRSAKIRPIKSVGVVLKGIPAISKPVWKALHSPVVGSKGSAHGGGGGDSRQESFACASTHFPLHVPAADPAVQSLTSLSAQPISHLLP